MVVSQKILGPTPKSQSPTRQHVHSWWNYWVSILGHILLMVQKSPKTTTWDLGCFLKPFMKEWKICHINWWVCLQLVSLPDFLNHQTRCLESSAPPGWMVPAKIASEMKVGFTLPAMVFLGWFLGGSCGVYEFNHGKSPFCFTTI